MILAELEVFLSRPIAPTRRIALGALDLPCDPAPGFGGILLGGIVARFFRELDEDTAIDIASLLDDVELGRRIAQPRARHRLQVDRIGLRPAHHRLIGHGERLGLDLDTAKGTPAQHVLSAVYASATLPRSSRPAVHSAIRKGMKWHAAVGAPLIAHLAGHGVDASVSAAADPVGWALRVLCLVAADQRGDDVVVLNSAGTAASSNATSSNATSSKATRLAAAAMPTRKDVQQAFREQLRNVHPDHGADDEGAAQRISELADARRILLG